MLTRNRISTIVSVLTRNTVSDAKRGENGAGEHKMKTFNKSFGKLFGVCGLWLSSRNWFFGIGIASVVGLTIGTHKRNSFCIGRWMIVNTFPKVTV